MFVNTDFSMFVNTSLYALKYVCKHMFICTNFQCFVYVVCLPVHIGLHAQLEQLVPKEMGEGWGFGCITKLYIHKNSWAQEGAIFNGK